MRNDARGGRGALATKRGGARAGHLTRGLHCGGEVVQCGGFMPNDVTPPAAADPSDPRPSKAGRYGGWIVFALVLVSALAIWLRNRDILSDLYDYSSVIVSAGKIEAGLKPYVDFRSTMQSACYVLSRGAEIIFGRKYLSLTFGGLSLIVGGASVLFALWRRQFSPWLAGMLTGAVTLGGLAQHVVIFYNPVGLLCLAVVVAGMPELCREKRPWNWRLLAVMGALILGGANKINFHGIAMGLAGLMVLAAAAQGQISWRRLGQWWAGLIVVGLVVPWGWELWWTGASLELWFYNVVLLAEERVGFVGLIFSPQTYAGPTYDLHRFILIKPLHTIGLVFILGVVVMAWRKMAGWQSRGALMLLAGAGAAGGVLLTVTNVESIALTSQGTLVAAIAVAASFGLMRSKLGQIWLAMAACLWIGVGGYAAWQGSRVMYARNNFDRSTFVRLVDAPKPIRYLEGVRLDAGLHESLLILSKDLEAIERQRGNLSQVWFGPTLEWLERAYPESIMLGMPVWYHVGTALRRSDGPWLIESMQKKEITNFYVHPGWEGWPDDFTAYLEDNYRIAPVGVLRSYELKSRTVPAEQPLKSFAVQDQVMGMIERTGSTIHLGTTEVRAASAPILYPSPWGEFYGATGSWAWEWQRNVRQVEGVFIATLGSGAKGTDTIQINWRVVADPEGTREVLWTGKAVLGASEPEQRAPFRFQALGRRVSLEIEVEGPAASDVRSGWREVRITHAGEVDLTTPPPGLKQAGAAQQGALSDGQLSWRRWMDGADAGDEAVGALTAHPFEIWSAGPAEGGEWVATIEIEPVPDSNGVVPILMLMWFKSGRLELVQQLAPPIPQGTFVVKGRSPEPGGWIGIAVRPVEKDRPLHSQLRVLRWSE